MNPSELPPSMERATDAAAIRKLKPLADEATVELVRLNPGRSAAKLSAIADINPVVMATQLLRLCRERKLKLVPAEGPGAPVYLIAEN